VTVYKTAAQGYITNWGTIIRFSGYKMEKFVPLKMFLTREKKCRVNSM